MDADLYDKSRFDDVRLTVDSGPEFVVGSLKTHVAAAYQQMWYGNRPYSKGLGGNLNTTVPLSSSAQLALTSSLCGRRSLPIKDRTAGKHLWMPTS